MKEDVMKLQILVWSFTLPCTIATTFFSTYLWSSWWAISLSGLVGLVASEIILKVFLALHINRLPLSIQRPVYLRWKKNLLATCDKHPLVGFPMMCFTELEMDRHFEQGGFRQVKEATAKKLKSISDGLNEYVEHVTKQRMT